MRADGYLVSGNPWMNEAFVAEAKEEGAEAEAEAETEAEAEAKAEAEAAAVLHCVDDMSHACTTAHAVRDVAARLGIGTRRTLTLTLTLPLPSPLTPPL